MRDTFGNANEGLRGLAERAAGLHYESAAAKKIMDERDWEDHWPVVDADGDLTGDVVENADCGGYFNVDDEVMVSEDDLTPEIIAENGGINSIRESGYVNLPCKT